MIATISDRKEWYCWIESVDFLALGRVKSCLALSCPYTPSNRCSRSCLGVKLSTGDFVVKPIQIYQLMYLKVNKG
jgi:hypothetical protein